MARTTNTAPGRRRRHRRAALWALALILGGGLLLPLTGYLYVAVTPAAAQPVGDTNPRANFWRAVRQGNEGYSAVAGPESGVLIENGGQNWRQLRNGLVANVGGWVLFLTLCAIMIFFQFRGRVDLVKGRSGERVLRWNGWERFVHWYTAILFLILAATGMSLLFGRALMIPLFGYAGFAAWAGLAKGLHNITGPAFAIGVVLMIATWIKDNLPKPEDLAWFAKGGGIIGRAHPDAGRMNGGEKAWFWFIVLAGGASIVTGFIMDFPNYDQSRSTMQISNLIHGALSLLWVAGWFGHAFIGTIGSEGSLEGMTTGYVDRNWAEQHHNLWLAELEAEPQAEGEKAGEEDAVGGEQPA